MEYKKTSLFSKKLQREVTVETYETEDHIIVSTKSLKKLFESIKSELGIKDTITSNILYTDKGLFLHASAKWRVEDKNGYCSEFLGEATPSSLDSSINKKYPEVTACNRAQSAGIISYLQLPKKMYSDTQITPVAGESSEPKKAADVLEDALNRKAKQPERPIMPAAEIPTSNTTKADSKEETKEAEKAKEVKGVIQDAPDMAENILPYAGEEEAVSIDEKKDQSEDLIQSETVASTVSEDSKFGLSAIFGDKTIKQVVEDYRNGDKQTTGFMKLIISGTFIPQTKEALEVTEFVKKLL